MTDKRDIKLKLDNLNSERIKNIAIQHNIREEILIDLRKAIEEYLSVSESFELFRRLPQPKMEMSLLENNPTAWAELSLYFHDYCQNTIKPPDVFTSAIFNKGNETGNKYVFPAEIANEILYIYLKSKYEDHQLLYRMTAISFLKEHSRKGKRKTEFYSVRNDLVSISAQHLRRNKVKNYALVIVDLLKAIGIKGLTANNIGTIVKRLT